MTPPITITVDSARTIARASGPFILGNTYAVEFAGLSEAEASAKPEVIVLGARPGEIAARSGGDEEGHLAFTTQACVDAFRVVRPAPPPYERHKAFPIPPPTPTPPLHGADRPHGSVRLHFYVVVNDATLAQGDLELKWAPFEYDGVGEPISLQGPEGKPGPPGPEGKPGRNGVYVETSGLYAFHVSEQGDHDEDGHLWIHAQDDTTLYAKDSNGNFILDANGNKIPLYYIDDNGHLKYRFYHGGSDHAELDLGCVIARTGLYALHVADGTVDGEIAGHLYLHGQDLSSLYATDKDGKQIVDKDGNPIPLFTIDERGHLIYTIYTTGGEVHASLDIGNVRGPQGAAFTFADLTDAQKAELKGAPGDPGPQGAALTFADLTDAQKAELKGAPGDPGKDGKDGMTETEIRQIVETQMQNGTPDDAPVAGSKKWVTSGGLYSVVEAIIARINALQSRYGRVMHYRGSVATSALLPTTGNELGDVFNVLDSGDNYAWAGTAWDKLSGIVDLSAYRTAEEQDAIDATKASAEEVISLLNLKADMSYVEHLDDILSRVADNVDVHTENKADKIDVDSLREEVASMPHSLPDETDPVFARERNFLPIKTSGVVDRYGNGIYSGEDLMFVPDPAVAIYRLTAHVDSGDGCYMLPVVQKRDVKDVFGDEASSVYAFEWELHVPEDATLLLDPNVLPDSLSPDVFPQVPVTWIEGGELPTEGFAGKTLYIALRLDLSTYTMLANCWRVV